MRSGDRPGLQSLPHFAGVQCSERLSRAGKTALGHNWVCLGTKVQPRVQQNPALHSLPDTNGQPAQKQLKLALKALKQQVKAQKTRPKEHRLGGDGTGQQARILPDTNG
jgi:hypothetical protein